MKLKNLDLPTEEIVAIAMRVAQSIARKRTVGGYDAEDIVQDALARVVSDIDRCEAASESQFAAWVMRVANNAVNTVVRAKCTKMRSTPTVGGDIVYELQGRADVAEDLVIAAETRSRIEALPGGEFVPFLESCDHGSQIELANSMGISGVVLRGRIKRFRDRVESVVGK